MMKFITISIFTVGILLIMNGIVNIIDDSRILTYDITSILSGIGFLFISRLKRSSSQ